MRKMKCNWFIIFFVVLLLLLGYFFWFFSQHNKKIVFEQYAHPLLGIQFQYPSQWKAKQNGLIQGYPTQYSGKEGFFVVSTLEETVLSFSTVRDFAASEIYMFGTNPTIRETISNSQLGFYLLPDSTLFIDEDHPACYITTLPHPVFYNGKTCHLVLIFSDETNLKMIVNSLVPYYPS